MSFVAQCAAVRNWRLPTSVPPQKLSNVPFPSVSMRKESLCRILARVRRLAVDDPAAARVGRCGSGEREQQERGRRQHEQPTDGERTVFRPSTGA